MLGAVSKPPWIFTGEVVQLWDFGSDEALWFCHRQAFFVLPGKIESDLWIM